MKQIRELKVLSDNCKEKSQHLLPAPLRFIRLHCFALLCVLFYCTTSTGQTIAGFRANGKIVSQGDTVNICVGGHIIYESTALNFTSLGWRFKNGSPIAGSSTYQDITYSVPGLDTTWQLANSATNRDSIFILVLVSNVKPVANYTFTPDGQCGNTTVVFTNTSGGSGLTYVWDFNDNIKTSVANPSHQFLSAIGSAGTQTFNVKLLVTNNQFCRDSVTKIVTVKRVPDAAIGNADVSVVYAVLNGIPTFSRCDPSSSHTFKFVNQTTTFGIITRYTIRWGDGSPDSVIIGLPVGGTFNHVYAKGFYELTVTAEGSNGCNGIKKYNIFLGTDPKGAINSIGSNSICSPNLKEFAITGYQTNPPGTTYTVLVNDGTTAVTFSHPPPDTITHLFLDGSCGNTSTNGAQTFPNSFNVTLITENPCGITSSSQVPVYVSGRPKAKISLNEYQCINKQIDILNTSLFGGKVEPTGGGNSTCENIGVSVWTISPSTGYTITAGTLGNLNGSSLSSIGWTAGSPNLKIIFTTPGLYTVKLYIGNGQCGTDSTVRVVCARDVSASFNLSQHSGCGPVTVIPNNTSPATGGCIGDMYNWSISYTDLQGCGGTAGYNYVNGTNSSSRTPQINFINPGKYTLSLYVYANGTFDCYAMVSDTFLVKGKPTVKINPINAVCLGNPINPTANVVNCYNASSLNYNWNFSGGSPTSSTLLVPGNVVYSGYGTFPIVLSVTNDCGITSDTANGIIISSPLPSAGPDRKLCSGDPTQIGTLPISGITYQWSPITNLNNPAIPNPTVTLSYNGPNVDTTYVFFVAASAGSGCVNVDTMSIVVSKKPVVVVSPSTVDICAGTSTPLVANGASTYVWTPIIGLSSSSGSNVLASPATTTIYSVTGSIPSGCFGTGIAAVNVKPSPVVNAGFDTTVCSFSPPAQLNATPSGGTWGGSAFLSPAGIFNPVAAGNGIYNLTYTVTAAGCTKTDTVTLAVIDAPVVKAGNDSTFCQDSIAVQLTGSPAGGRWTGTGVTLTGLLNTTLPGTYTLVYTFGAGLCTGRDTVVITVTGGILNNTISSNQTICSGSAPAGLSGSVISGGQGVAKYQWQISTNNTLWNDIAGAVLQNYAPGNLSQTTWFRRIASNTICSGPQSSTSASIRIGINPEAKAEFGPTITSGCPPFVITPSIVNLTTYSSVSEYRWYADGIYLGSGQVFPGYTLVNNNDSVKIKLVAISAFGCRNDSVQHNFVAAGSPQVNAGKDSAVCQGGLPFQLLASPAGGGWSGTFVTLSGLFTPSTMGNYTLVYTYGSGLCIGRDTVVVTVSNGISNNTISGAQAICTGTSPSMITGQNVSGGVGTPVYQWQSGTNNITWVNIPGATAKDYTPGILTQDTWFRREATTTLCAAAQTNNSPSVLITVRPNAKADFNPPITSGCPPFVITPSIVNLTTYSSVSEYRWYADGVYLGSGQVFPGYTLVNNNDSVKIKLVAISAFGCKNDSLQHNFVAAGSPQVNAGKDSAVCQGGLPFQLLASPAGGGWSGTFVTLSGLFTPSTMGNYTLVYTYGSGLCIGRDTVVVTVSNGISNNTISGAQAICTGTSPSMITGQNVSGGVGTPVYQWQSGTNNITWVNIPGATAKDYTPGMLTQDTWFRREATTTLCAAAQTNNSPSVLITVRPNARADFNPPITSGCPPFVITPSIVNLTTYSSVSEYRWYADGVYLGSGQVFPGYTLVNNNDSVKIKLVAISAFGCKNDSVQHNFVAAGSPQVNAGKDSAVCQGGLPFQLLASPAGGGWSGAFVTLSGLFTPSTMGNYTLVYTYGSGLCIGRDTVVVTVSNGISNNTISGAQAICTGTSPSMITGQNVSGGVGTPVYQWQSGTNNITWINIPGATAKDYTPGILTQDTWFRREATTTLCAAAQTNNSPSVLITVRPNAKADFNPPITSGCPPFVITPSIVNLTTYSSVSEYRWYADGVYLGSGQVFPGYTLVNNNDSVKIKLVAISAFGCKNDSVQHNFVAAGSPQVNAGKDSAVCQGGLPFQLLASPAGGGWSGTFVTLSGLFTPSTMGNYTLVYTYGSGLCIGRDTVVVTVSNGISNNTISGAQAICTGTSPSMITGQNVSGGVGTPVYQWQSGTNNITWINIPGATAKDYTPGILTQDTWFRREATTTLCAAAQTNNSPSVLITVRPNAKADFNPPITSGCPPFVITPSIVNLTTYSSVSEYRWYADGVYLGSGQIFPGYTLLNNNDTVTIKLVAISAFGCKNDSTLHGFVAAGTPSVSAGKDTIICHNTFPVQLNGAPAGGRWSGTPLITIGGIFTPSTPGIYTVVYTYGSGSCVGSDSIKVNVSQGISSNIISSNQTICSGTQPAAITGLQITGGNGPASYQWQISTDSVSWANISGATSTNFTPGTLSQVTWYRRIASTTVCSGLQSVTSVPVKIAINPDARAVFTPTSTSGCVPFVITPFIINLSAFTGISEYRWYVNNNYVGSGQNFPGYTITTNNDSVTIKLVAISRFGCKNDSMQHGFVTGDAPAPSFTQSDSIACGPMVVNFTNTTINASRYNYIWNFGNSQISTLQQPGPVTFATALNGGDTTYTIKMTAATSCDTLSVIRYVTVRGKPRAAFTPDRIEGCSPMTVTFTNNTPGSNVNYVWNFGDGSQPLASTNSAVQHAYTAGIRTTFQVKLVAANDCGADSINSAIIVNANAIRIFYSVNANESLGCAPHTVKFVNNTVGALSFRYDFGDGSFLNTTRANDTITHTYLANGTYNATLKATGICNDTTAMLQIVVRTKPIANFTAVPLVTCMGDSVRFTNISDTATNSFWRFGDGTISYTRNPVKSYAAAGSYRVWLVVNWNFTGAASCSDSVYQDIFIKDTLQGSVLLSDSISTCLPFTATFRNLNGPSAQTFWNFGDGTTASGDSASHTYTIVGVYKVVMITRSLSGCTFKETRTIRVNAPAGTFVYNSGYACLNENVRFEVRAGNAKQYLFTFGDGDSLTSPNSIVFHPYTLPGKYVPYVYLLDGTCRILLTVGDTIKVDRIKAGFTATSIRSCGVTNVQFRDTSAAFYGVGGWLWDFGDGTVSSARNPNKAYTRDGIYYVRLLATGLSGCTDTLRFPLSVSVRQFPVAVIGGDSAACTGQPVRLAALIQSQDSVTTVSWSFGNNTFANGYNVSPVYNAPATYTVRLITTTLYGCTDTTYKSIRVNSTPVINAGSDLRICRGQSVNLNAFGAATYTWSPLQNLSCSTCANPVASPLLSVQYIAYGTTLLGCTSSDTVKVEVVQPFKITVSADDTICIGEKTQLSAGGATGYFWNPVSGLSSGNIPNPVASPTNTTRYTVIGNDAFTCFTDTAYVTIVTGAYPTVKLGNGGTVLVGSALQLTPTITNGPIRNYLWSPADDLSCTTCPRPLAMINKNISYKLEVENIYGCKSTDTISFKVRCDEALQLYVPNAFSPDSDGINDMFMVRGRGLAMVKYFRVFNRWGQLVFEKTNFAANDRKYGWDGRVNGTPANPDVYVYTVEVICAAGDVFVKKGNVTLVR